MNKIKNFFKAVFSNLGAVLGMLATGVLVVALIPVFLLCMGVAHIVDFVQMIKNRNKQPEFYDEDVNEIIDGFFTPEEAARIKSQAEPQFTVVAPQKTETRHETTEPTRLIRKMVKVEPKTI